MTWKLEAPPLHTVPFWCAYRSSFLAEHPAHIKPRPPHHRIVNRISCCALVIATALLVGCSDSLIRGGSLSAGSNLTGSGNISVPPQAPSLPPEAPSAPSQNPIVVPAPEPTPEPTPTPTPAPEPTPEPTPTPTPAPEPTPEPTPTPTPTPDPVTLCSSGLAAQDLAGQCRAVPPTPGALEASDGTSSAGITLASLSVAQTASRVLEVSWQPFGNNTSGYLVNYGKTPDTASALVSDLPTNSGLINPASPTVTYDSVRDLGLYVGETVCFRIQAYNSARTVIAEVFLGCSAI